MKPNAASQKRNFTGGSYRKSLTQTNLSRYSIRRKFGRETDGDALRNPRFRLEFEGCRAIAPDLFGVLPLLIGHNDSVRAFGQTPLTWGC